MRTGHRINLQRPIRLTVFWLVAAVLLSVSNAAHAQEAQSLLEYAPDDFFGGAVVRLDKLRKSDRHLLLPLDALLPSGIALDRVSNSVDQFVVFVKDGADLVSPPRLPEQYELAAVAEFSQPVTKQSANEAIARLNSGVTGTQANIDVLTDSFRIGQTTCYRVDSGTIFHSRNRHGSLSFLDRKGKATKKGINVGDYVPRGYIEGQTKAKAIFHFDQLSASDLIGDTLTLDLRLDVFPIGRRFRDYIRARIYLRSSDGKLESEPVALKARSHGRYLVEFSRQLSVVDQNAAPTGNQQKVDLLDEFSNAGRFDVVLECDDKISYVGVTSHDLSIKNRTSEYLAIVGRYLIIAQSRKTLAEMLTRQAAAQNIAALKRNLSQKLQPHDDQEILVVFETRNRADRNSLKQLLSSLALDELASILPASMTACWFSVTMENPTIMSADFKLGSIAAISLQSTLEHRVKQAQLVTRDGAIEFAQFHDWMATLIQFGKPVSVTFPDQSIDRRKLHERVNQLVDSFFKSITTRIEKDRLLVKCRWLKQISPEDLNDLDRAACSVLQLWRARTLSREKRFGDTVWSSRRLTSLFPTSTSLRVRIAHQQSFNTPPEFESYEQKYQWIRTGITTLLDGADDNPDSVDLIWVAGEFIEYRIGRSDENRPLRKLFSNDDKLLRRLRRYTDIRQNQNGVGNVDPFVTAKGMFDYCVRQAQQSSTLGVFPFLVESKPIELAAESARSMAANGKFEEAAKQWKEVSRLCEELGSREVQFTKTTQFAITDAEQHLDSLDKGIAEAVKANYDWFNEQTYEASIEQTELARSIRQRNYHAMELLRQNKNQDAVGEYQAALNELAKLVAKYPADTEQIIAAYRDLLYARPWFGLEVDDTLPPDVLKIFRREKEERQNSLRNRIPIP